VTVQALGWLVKFAGDPAGPGRCWLLLEAWGLLSKNTEHKPQCIHDQTGCHNAGEESNCSK